MLPPLPRCSGWAYSTLISPSHVSLPRKGHRVGLHIVLFEACSAFTRVAACTLARSPYFVTRYPKASDISSPPCLLRLLPAGAVAGWDLHPLESAAFSRRTPVAGNCVPSLLGRGGTGACSRACRAWWAADRGAHRPGDRREVWRSSPLLSAGRNLRSSRDRARWAIGRDAPAFISIRLPITAAQCCQFHPCAERCR